MAPTAILHAGDIGDLRVLEELATVAQVFAVRGNIDARTSELPDVLVLDVLREGSAASLRVLLVHIAVAGPRLRREIAQLVGAEHANLVVCGHSHVPFIGRDRGIAVFNPGSIGPRRFGLPIVMGSINLHMDRVQLAHLDCETGQRWEPPR